MCRTIHCIRCISFIGCPALPCQRSVAAARRGWCIAQIHCFRPDQRLVRRDMEREVCRNNYYIRLLEQRVVIMKFCSLDIQQIVTIFPCLKVIEERRLCNVRCVAFSVLISLLLCSHGMSDETIGLAMMSLTVCSVCCLLNLPEACLQTIDCQLQKQQPILIGILFNLYSI